MLYRKLTSNCCKFCKFLNTRSLHKTSSLQHEREFENPIHRALRILADDLNFKKKFERMQNPQNVPPSNEVPNHADIVIIGGGAIGSSIAYWLKEKSSKDGFKVAVLEKDPSFKNCTTALSMGGLHGHFSLPETIQMAMFGAEFIRMGKKRLGSEFNANYQPHSYLSLANEADASFMVDSHQLQKEMGIENVLLSKEGLKQRFPWMDVSDVELGCLGLEREGWFEAMTLLNGIQESAMKLGAQYIHGEVVGFMDSDIEDIYVQGVQQGSYQGIQSLVVKLPNGEQKIIDFAICIIAAGYETKNVGHLAKIGTGDGLLSIGLPLRQMRRHLCYFDCLENPPGLNTPMVADHTGVYFRRHGLGGSFIAGFSNEVENDGKIEEKQSTENSSQLDHSYFENVIKPALTQRVPAFKNIKINGFWRGLYDYNAYDLNGIIGPHPYYTNMYLATGFSGHGIQLAPAIGRGIAELILDGKYSTLDLTRLCFDRMLVDKPMYEIAPC